ncbi:MAG: hypothetical protein ACLFPA_11335 [Dichotomicrobium sp.]
MARSKAVVQTFNRGRESYVDTRHLSPEARLLCWRGMKKLNPEKARMLEHDAFIAALRERFGEQVHLQIELDEYRRYVTAGREVANAPAEDTH